MATFLFYLGVPEGMERLVDMEHILGPQGVGVGSGVLACHSKHHHSSQQTVVQQGVDAGLLVCELKYDRYYYNVLVWPCA